MSDDRRSVLQVIGVAVLILCACMVFLSLPFFWQQYKVLKFWPVRQGQVLRNEIAVVAGPGHEQSYAVRLQVLYTVDEKPFTSELTSFESKNYQASVARAAEFPVGSRHQLRYNPADPTEARIGAGWNSRFFAVPLLLLGLGAAFAAVAGGLFFAAKSASHN